MAQALFGPQKDTTSNKIGLISGSYWKGALVSESGLKRLVENGA